MRKVEIFTAGCPLCEPVVNLVKALACSSCQVLIYERDEDTNFSSKAKKYNIQYLPAIAVDGELLPSTDYNTLVNAGIGSAN